MGPPFNSGTYDPDLVKMYDATNAGTRLTYSFYNQGPEPKQLPNRSESDFPINSHKHATEQWSEQAPYRIEVNNFK